MPLLPGKSNIGRNIETEEDAGKRHDQAVAIALDVARRAHRSEGGETKKYTGPGGVAASAQELRDAWGKRGVKLEAYDAKSRPDLMTLHSLVVPKEHRGKGIGSTAMRDITAHADAHGKTLALTPSTDFGGSSKSRLEEFYKRFGFRENAGRHKDFTISESMYREPSTSRKPRASGGRSDETEYRGEHQAPMSDSGSPMHDLTKNKTYPKDVYGANGFRYYADNGDPMDRQSFYDVMRHHGHPNRQISVYRAVPKDVKGSVINKGDWVTHNRAYAKLHGEGPLNGDYRISEKKVHVRDLFTNGDSIHEWGYDPQPYTGYAEEKAALEKAKADRHEAYNVDRLKRADGGATMIRFHVGPIHASVAGRTDHLPMTVESGSYVLPADIVSAGGEGNTLAGFKVLRRTFGGEPYGQSGAPYGQDSGVYGLPVRYAKGGAVKAAGVLFLSPEQEVLLMRRSKGEDDHNGEWAFPAGQIEHGETPEAAARRETREETGHEHDGGLSPFMHRHAQGVDFVTYLAHSPDKFKPHLNDEHDDAKWVSLDEAEKLPLHPGVRAALEKLEARVRKAGGGEASGVPIVAAGGEWVISPRQVEKIGGGDIDVGHRVLDQFVLRVRRELISTLKGLPGPKKD